MSLDLFEGDWEEPGALTAADLRTEPVALDASLFEAIDRVTSGREMTRHAFESMTVGLRYSIPHATLLSELYALYDSFMHRGDESLGETEIQRGLRDALPSDLFLEVLAYGQRPELKETYDEPDPDDLDSLV